MKTVITKPTLSSVYIDPGDTGATLAALEALGDLSGKIINEKSNELIKNIFKGIVPDDELEKLIADIEEKECSH